MLRCSVPISPLVCLAQYYLALAWALLSVAMFRSCILVIISRVTSMLERAVSLDFRKYELQADIFTTLVVCRRCVNTLYISIILCKLLVLKFISIFISSIKYRFLRLSVYYFLFITHTTIPSY